MRERCNRTTAEFRKAGRETRRAPSLKPGRVFLVRPAPRQGIHAAGLSCPAISLVTRSEI